MQALTGDENILCITICIMIRITTKSRSQGEEQVSKTHSRAGNRQDSRSWKDKNIVEARRVWSFGITEDPSAFTKMWTWYLAQCCGNRRTIYNTHNDAHM